MSTEIHKANISQCSNISDGKEWSEKMDKMRSNVNTDPVATPSIRSKLKRPSSTPSEDDAKVTIMYNIVNEINSAMKQIPVAAKDGKFHSGSNIAASQSAAPVRPLIPAVTSVCCETSAAPALSDSTAVMPPSQSSSAYILAELNADDEGLSREGDMEVEYAKLSKRY
jgi:hypothetical protein